MAMRTDVFQQSDEKLSRVLLRKSLISAAALDNLKTQAAQFSQTLFQYIIQHGFVDAKKLQVACNEFFHVNPNGFDFEKIVEHEIFFDVIQNHFAVPILEDDQKCAIALANPDDQHIAKTLSFKLKMPVEIQWVRYDILLRHHNRTLSALFYKQAQKKEISAKKIAYHLLSDAIHQKASDIHIENYQNTFRVRFRCDGLL